MAQPKISKPTQVMEAFSTTALAAALGRQTRAFGNSAAIASLKKASASFTQAAEKLKQSAQPPRHDAAKES